MVYAISLGIQENVCPTSIRLFVTRLELTCRIIVLSLKGAYRTGYAVLGASAITTVALVLL